MGTDVTISYSDCEGDSIDIIVKDEGMGIAIEDQEQIFERFYRVNGSETLSIAGFGIGLYLCREIIELHQGKISLNSEMGVGTTFTVRLPRRR